jgi:hypothetical protein
LYVAAGLAAAARVLKTYHPSLAEEALETAVLLYEQYAQSEGLEAARIIALCELLLTTRNDTYRDRLLGMEEAIIRNLPRSGWAVGHALPLLDDEDFRQAVGAAVAAYQQELRTAQRTDSPYGVPYEPNIWGAGWAIQRFGVEQYFFYRGWPELCGTQFVEQALHFILGVHPGSNTASFASGVGSRSVTVAYGVNRADWSFIPGGVASGTALIRPDLPELKVWPFFWQQTEYVMGGGSTDYMFLVLAVNQLYQQAGR